MQYNRKKTRKLLFQKLYAMCFNQFKDEEFFETFFEGVFTFNVDEDYMNEMVDIIVDKQSFFVDVIKKYSPKFDVANMNIMYILPVFIGLAEMFYLKEEIPGKVSINEAVEVAKVYGDDSAKKIVNGILNKVLENHEELDKLKEEKTESNINIIRKKVSE